VTADLGPLGENEFRVSDVPPGHGLQVGGLAVFNVGGRFCATEARCSHRQGPLAEGTLDGSVVTCPWHGSQFDVCTGVVLRGPAAMALATYPVTVEGEIGRIGTEPAESRPGDVAEAGPEEAREAG
jgi:nitrite reductase/ring-hydroxylating ferredoxin subunit